ncbi:4Fe-4S ferredoxin iron-sulfur binding domain-containing protein [Tepidanaerobacter acetatoxydans Re1]|uniref:4Fe-4S ferredoxin iron-sulfur binding domain-containing protein n=1 Tax=Tepidanaerobacter acetatoxydans (strain DSM 21804 / JCM 16047 / Re1) TaxID=1209989 RepID=F4LX93_TEPAE|nr:Coenzyme F420 hydrogenase/dehydrogenase, beta subunit C-terminal domain [Tepidanaerobacter acetatoxydans]AEE91892.1 4Fe-4S ferredoxin iron-sulfur binding domain-containing protein [Tepidanaerobacter acetatoxydans Re1]CCP26711.1 4Fe-4S ferredoxin iron-sulfur binding domain-containing protein [Tepidanaerobacter acetatoxydans Re1]
MICDKDVCTGCGVCYNVCPVKCITMKYDSEGFIFPIIDEQQCIKCNKCRENCPSLNELTNNNCKEPITIGCWNKNQDILKKSSSGGAFAAIAEDILKEDGVVVGCVMDKNLNIYHTIAENFEELEEMYGSKYVQSETHNIYRKIKVFLNKGKKVLFVGCPCQVAGVYTYLKDEEYKNLITIDLVCHGVGSKKFFDKYINEMNNKYKDKVIGVSFRNKRNGRRNYTTRLSFTTRPPVYIPAIKDSYMTCYLQRAIYRKSCYSCKYAKLPRVGDITIGDFVGIDRNQISKRDYYNGVSVVLLNNSKGTYYFENIKLNLNWLERPLQEATSTNSNIIEPSIMPDSRKLILNDVGTVEQLKNKYCKYPLKARIANILGDDVVRALKKVFSRFKS